MNEEINWLVGAIQRAQDELDQAGQGGVAKNFSRVIVHDDRYIAIYLRKSGVIEYLDYTPDLFQFLCTPSKCSYKVNSRGRTQIELSKCHFLFKNEFVPYISRFAYFYYKSGINAEQFAGEFRSINKKHMSTLEQVDHVNDDFHNNCKWNLTLVGAKENNHSGKGRKLAKIKPPYFCFPVACPGGGYRVKFGCIVGGLPTVYVYCEGIEQLIDFLDSVFDRFVSTSELPEQLSRYGSPKDAEKKRIFGNFYFSNSFENASKVADEMLSMSADRFIPWQSGTAWTTWPIATKV